MSPETLKAELEIERLIGLLVQRDDHIAALQAENARLRAAIEDAERDLDMATTLEGQGATDPAGWRDMALQTLRAALKA